MWVPHGHRLPLNMCFANQGLDGAADSSSSRPRVRICPQLRRADMAARWTSSSAVVEELRPGRFEPPRSPPAMLLLPAPVSSPACSRWPYHAAAAAAGWPMPRRRCPPQLPRPPPQLTPHPATFVLTCSSSGRRHDVHVLQHRRPRPRSPPSPSRSSWRTSTPLAARRTTTRPGLPARPSRGCAHRAC